jgi:pimeloyl-ACP methyl ester carboxylesterase
VLALVGCAPHKLYRTDMTNCASTNPELECRDHTLQERTDPANPDYNYLLGFIEFDDQGQLFDRKQMQAVLGKLYEEVASADLLMVVFVHGWTHSAAPGDSNIQTFRESLERLSELESRISSQTGQPERKVAGIYLGWRGGSITLPVLENATFWDRKNTAQKVGHGGVTEVLNRLELVKKTKDSIADNGGSGTRLIVVGHSFGGAVVYTALSQILQDRFVHTVGPVGQVSDTEGFGDLVVLINPAFEALLFAPLSDMATERGTYFPRQLPVLAIMTSEADYATKLAFPLGRRFSTLFEKERTVTRKNGVTRAEQHIDEGASNITAVGHFDPYKTHYLRATDIEQAELRAAPPSVESAVQTFFDVSESWEKDEPGSKIVFEGSVLERSETSAGRNPYLAIQVDEELIKDHNDISDPRIASFVRQLILISSQSSDLAQRRKATQTPP